MLGEFLMCSREFSLHGRELGAASATCLLEFLPELQNELLLLGEFLLDPSEFSSKGREFSLLLLEGKSEFMPGSLALGSYVSLAARLLQFLFELVNELVLLGKLQLRPSNLGFVLFKGDLEFPGA